MSSIPSLGCYKVESFLEAGTTSQVYKVSLPSSSSSLYAFKHYKVAEDKLREKYLKIQFQTEITCLTLLNKLKKKQEEEGHHLKTKPNWGAIQLLDIQPSLHGLLLEYFPEKDIYEYIIKNGSFSLSFCQTIFRQLLTTIQYCHQLGFIHADLKPEQILIRNSQEIEKVEVRICDFGAARLLDTDKKTVKLVKKSNGLIGTSMYLPPEMVDYYCKSKIQSFTTAIDVWGLGIILFIIYCGFPPFQDTNTMKCSWYKLFREAGSEIYFQEINKLLQKRGQHILSGTIQSILMQMFTIDPEARITIEELWKHPFVTPTN